MKPMKKFIQQLFYPLFAYYVRRKMRTLFLRTQSKAQKQQTYNTPPSSHREIFSEIYSQNKWGRPTQGVSFYSGPGSYGEASKKYVSYVRKFIQQHKISSVTDVGCGDFHIGRQLCENLDIKYTGVDVVEDLIAHNQKHFGTSNTH